MKKRIAYIGLTTPILLDYDNPASRTINYIGRHGSPNPILQSPFGLMLLYDEIWFLCEGLCPENMRKLPYVFFIDQLISELPINDLLLQSFNNYIECGVDLNELSYSEGVEYCNRIISELSDEKDYIDKLNRVGINASKDSSFMSSSFQLMINNCYCHLDDYQANCIFDILMISYLNEKVNVELELISSFSNELFIYNCSNGYETILAEEMTINNIPNYTSLKGPYHPCIEDARNDPYIIDFRKWIKSKEISSHQEVVDICIKAEEIIEQLKNDLFDKWLDKKTYYNSIGKTFVEALVGTVVPFYSTVSSVAKDIKCIKNTKQHRWQMFVVNSKKYFRHF